MFRSLTSVNRITGSDFDLLLRHPRRSPRSPSFPLPSPADPSIAAVLSFAPPLLFPLFFFPFFLFFSQRRAVDRIRRKPPRARRRGLATGRVGMLILV